jgi:HTH-type transcriptional regulator / antitoxin HigA
MECQKSLKEGGEEMTTVTLNKTFEIWENLDRELHRLLKPIKTEAEYEAAIDAFEALMERIHNNPNSSLVTLYQLLAEHIHTYEQEIPIPGSSPQEVLKFLMQQHHLRQEDLKDIGSQGVISELLLGRRRINIRQAKLLAQRFRVNPAVFI